MIRTSLKLYHTSRLLTPLANRNLPALTPKLAVVSSANTTLYRHKSTTSPATAVIPQEKPGLFKRIAKSLFDSSRGKYISLGVLLYEKCANEPNFVEFVKVLGLPDTFNSWFLVTELHVWMVMTKCSVMENNGRHMRNSMVKMMWDDCSQKLKTLHVPRSGSVLQELDQQLKAAIFAYDEGIMSSDTVLASALWRRFYIDNSSDIKGEELEILVSYVRRQIAELHALSDEEFSKKPTFTWVPLKV
ncbi:ubiquinol-cytochrome-c reductase complex assembly factor 1 isoform X2 [Neocloeon triangulifer]|uniref:ubiquinol-cytochrome-c reductase complex assembly factor 1 isoform X2 n=1 Tax=Neocloeon triangulifer TaxID=2078957 RepID=UPI00286EBF03|nr:ubiquinol-cytochrome-c reductase complex assembly factor 1 isoform X2 [Neocloeon triangulifer]